jgi:coenzyme PQQ precursor peptide PqqA
LIRFRFGEPDCPLLLHCNKTRSGVMIKDFAGELFIKLYFNNDGGKVRPFARRAKMAWKAPKIVEVPCGMEINMYVSATRK